MPAVGAQVPVTTVAPAAARGTAAHPRRRAPAPIRQVDRRCRRRQSQRLRRRAGAVGAAPAARATFGSGPCARPGRHRLPASLPAALDLFALFGGRLRCGIYPRPDRRAEPTAGGGRARGRGGRVHGSGTLSSHHTAVARAEVSGLCRPDQSRGADGFPFFEGRISPPVAGAESHACDSDGNVVGRLLRVRAEAQCESVPEPAVTRRHGRLGGNSADDAHVPAPNSVAETAFARRATTHLSAPRCVAAAPAPSMPDAAYTLRDDARRRGSASAPAAAANSAAQRRAKAAAGYVVYGQPPGGPAAQPAAPRPLRLRRDAVAFYIRARLGRPECAADGDAVFARPVRPAHA